MSDELIVRHCAPTLAGLKTGNIFTCSYVSLEKLYDSMRTLNRRLLSKGLRVLPLRIGNNKALVYVYRPKKLEGDLLRNDAASILYQNGYTCGSSFKCISQLIERLRKSDEFPHEIGLFLGYPPEDVCGFIENRAKDCKCVGCWKVYGDVKKAEKLFARYKKCTEVYLRHYESGCTIERLTVRV